LPLDSIHQFANDVLEIGAMSVPRGGPKSKARAPKRRD
jgi:hypothetical protein